MQEISTPPNGLRGWPTRVGRHLMATGENRLELFMVELEQERHHFMAVAVLAVAAAVLALLAGIGVSAAIVVLLWQTYPVVVLFVLSGIYGLGAFLLYRRLMSVQQNWKIFPATIEQLQKDGECLKEILS